MKSILYGLIITTSVVNAQKLPGKQTISLRAPANVKIDGNTAEWGNKFQAYNTATDVYYTLANDNENIYLVVSAKDRYVIDKLLRGGITLTINHSSSKKDNEPVAITYPFLRGRNKNDVANMFARKQIEKSEAKNGDINVDNINELFGERSKTIKAAGINTISDNEISVYNTDGFKAAAQFSKQLVYTCELAIPLKHLLLPNNGAGKFAYQIKINDPYDEPASPVDGPPGPPMPVTSIAPTYLWGEYTIVKM